MISIIDIGTNTVILLIVKINPDKSWAVVHDESRIARLGEGLIDSGRFCTAAMERCFAALKNYKEIVKSHQCERVVLIGTAGFRGAANSSELVDRVKNELSWQIKVISGEEEARLIHKACVTDFKTLAKPILALDIGGGSTEFIFDDGNKIDATSLPFGVVKLTEKFLKTDPPTIAEQIALTKYVTKELKTNFPQPRHLGTSALQHNLIATAGTPTTVSAIKQKLAHYDAAKVHGSIVTKNEMQKIMDQILPLTFAERSKIPCLPEKRADVIVAGTLILKTVMDYFAINKFYVSDRGLRYGVLYDRFL